jgi:ParB-like chromosome segregation protein Spo0J
VIAGHGRLRACQSLGWSEVPTIRLDHLTEAQANAFMIADNRLTEISVWDDRLLAEQLKELSELDLDFSLEATGFQMGEIDLRIEGLTPATADERDPADALPAVKTGPAVSLRETQMDHDVAGEFFRTVVAEVRELKLTSDEINCS